MFKNKKIRYIEFLLKNKNQSYTGKSGIDLLNKIYQTINNEESVKDELHKSIFFENKIDELS